VGRRDGDAAVCGEERDGGGGGIQVCVDAGEDLVAPLDGSGDAEVVPPQSSGVVGVIAKEVDVLEGSPQTAGT